MSLRKSFTLIVTSLLLVAFLLLGSFALSPGECDANGPVKIGTPIDGSDIPYCTNFPVSANITAADGSDVLVSIEIVGNAELISGDTDGTPDTYYYENT